MSPGDIKIKLLRKIFGRKKKVSRKNITNYRNVGMERQVYDSKNDEWVWWYMLIITDPDGSEVECSEHNGHLAYEISMNENIGTSSIGESTSSTDSSWDSNYCSGGSSYSSSDSSSPSSYD